MAPTTRRRLPGGQGQRGGTHRRGVGGGGGLRPRAAGARRGNLVPGAWVRPGDRAWWAGCGGQLQIASASAPPANAAPTPVMTLPAALAAAKSHAPSSASRSVS